MLLTSLRITWALDVQAGNTLQVEVLAQGSTFTFYIDHSWAGELTDTDHPYMYGSIGFIGYSTPGIPKSHAVFHDVSVRELPN